MGLRTLGPNEQIKLFYSGSEPNSNKWLQYTMPHREASDKKIRELVVSALMLKAVDPKVMARTPTKEFIINGYTEGERTRLGAQGVTVHRIADPQLNTPIPDTLDIAFEATASINDMITFENYPMLRHTQLMFAEVLSAAADGEDKVATFCDLYRSAITSFESGGGAGFPAALYEILQEHNAFVEANLAGPDTAYVRQLWTFKDAQAPLGGYDTLGTVISQMFYLGIRAMNLMSTQIPAWLVLTMSILGGALRNTNKKLRFALIGTAETGKSVLGNKVRKGMPKTFDVIEGDDTELVKMYLGCQNAFRVSFRDEIADRGADPESKKKENGRGFRGALTAMEDGYIRSQRVNPGRNEDGSTEMTVEQTTQDMRTMEIICYNSMMASKAYESRQVVLRFRDPPKAESKRVKLVSQSNKTEADLASRLMKMMGFGQIITSFPSHFGLDPVGTNTQLLYLFCSLLESIGGRMSPFGRDLGQLENHLCNIVDLRLGAEAQRFKCVRPGTAERPTAPEMALQCMVNRVASPADVLAAYGSLNSCGFTTHQIVNALIEALIAMFQHRLQKSTEDDSRMIFTGFEVSGGHFIMQQMSANRRAADDVDVLADRVHSIVSALMPMSSPSLPDVKRGLEDLAQRFIAGSAALTTKAWSDPNDNDKGAVRWALSRDLIQKAKLDRLRSLMFGLEQLVSIIKRAKGQPYVSFDEEKWIIPLEGYGDVAMAPIDYKASSDRNLRKVADMVLLPPGMHTADPNAKSHMLNQGQADQYFRLAEQLGLISVDTFNSGKAYIAVDRENTSGPQSLKDPSKGLQEVTLSRGCISVNIALCKEYTATGGDGVDRMADVAKAFLAVSLPPASFKDPYKIYMGQETKLANGMVELTYVPHHDPTGFECTTTDWMFRKSTTEEEEFIGVAPQETANVMPGIAPTVTFNHGDALYEKLLRGHAKEHGLPEAYITYWHVPGWRP